MDRCRIGRLSIKLTGRVASSFLKVSEEDQDVPEEVESLLSDLLEALTDKVILRFYS